MVAIAGFTAIVLSKLLTDGEPARFAAFCNLIASASDFVPSFALLCAPIKLAFELSAEEAADGDESSGFAFNGTFNDVDSAAGCCCLEWPNDALFSILFEVMLSS